MLNLHRVLFCTGIYLDNIMQIDCLAYTVSHFSYAPFFQGPHFLTKMLESNIFNDNLSIGILSV